MGLFGSKAKSVYEKDCLKYTFRNIKDFDYKKEVKAKVNGNVIEFSGDIFKNGIILDENIIFADEQNNYFKIEGQPEAKPIKVPISEKLDEAYIVAVANFSSVDLKIEKK
jgi:hypothetical protein